MSLERPLNEDLDQVARNASSVLTQAKRHTAFQRALRGALPLIAWIPIAYVVLQIFVWLVGGTPTVLPLPVVIGAALLAPFAAAGWRTQAAAGPGISRAQAVGETDRQLTLEGRLLAADEYVRREQRSGFEQAALEDAAVRSKEAAAAVIEAGVTPVAMGRAVAAWGLGAIGVLALSVWVGGFGQRQGELDRGDTSVAMAGGPVTTPEPTEEAQESERRDEEVPTTEFLEARRIARDTKAEEAQKTPELGTDMKESSGKTGTGRSSGALSSSAASESKSSASSQGQKSEPSKQDPKQKPTSKKPKEPEQEPEQQERSEDEPSGSTAGKGSSKGSSKNPTASDWKSRDQVTDTDDQEVEDDEDTDEDEEEQENRGGVQPSLRDRRPPVSRDLQIGFGNRPNPDANGRGGPSEQKKSRGVASLVLGVPIPDRIKGRPGPGPTKITQERIEPELEEAEAIEAGARTPREAPIVRPTPLRPDASLRALVRDYFLLRRRGATPPAN